jgi:formylglycine-generating enzyme required for sulfatase activity
LARNPNYAPGTLPAPKLGLIPLGPDPHSTFEEFAETATGELPVRDGETGKLVPTETTALVFVLLPGGTFTMGAQSRDPSAPAFDPSAGREERPPHEVTLDPFFLSKYEMTQGQWLRFTGSNPSYYSPASGYQTDLRHPVEQVSWSEVRSVLERLGLGLPTESQWEYACRGATQSCFHTGDSAASLAGYANIGDEGSKAKWTPGWQFEEEFADGWPFSSPAGILQPNGFGLHDVHGNLREWCEDGFDGYRNDPRPGDGLRPVPGARLRVIRGGSFVMDAVVARCSYRNRAAPSITSFSLGLRPAASTH